MQNLLCAKFSVTWPKSVIAKASAKLIVLFFSCPVGATSCCPLRIRQKGLPQLPAEPLSPSLLPCGIAMAFSSQLRTMGSFMARNKLPEVQVMQWLHPLPLDCKCNAAFTQLCTLLLASGYHVLLLTLLFLGLNLITTVFFQHLKPTSILLHTLRYPDYKTWHRGPKILLDLPKLLPSTTALGAALASVLQFSPSCRSPHHTFLLSLHGLCSGDRVLVWVGFFPPPQLFCVLVMSTIGNCCRARSESICFSSVGWASCKKARSPYNYRASIAPTLQSEKHSSYCLLLFQVLRREASVAGM